MQKITETRMDDAKVKVNIQSLIHPYIFHTIIVKM